MLNGAFVGALFLHHLVEDGDVKRNHRNGRTRLGDEGLVNGDECRLFAKLSIHRGGGLLQVFFGAANGAIGVNGPCDLGSDVGIGDGFEVVSEDAGLFHGIDPHLPVFATHHFDGVGNFLFGGGLDGNFFNETLVGVEGVLSVGVASRLENRAVGLRRRRDRCGGEKRGSRQSYLLGRGPP